MTTNHPNTPAATAPTVTLPVALRAWTEPQQPPRKRPRKAAEDAPFARSGRPQVVTGPLVGTALVFDTETTVDAAQGLTFGSWRLVDILDSGELVRLQEGLFYADQLPETDPEGFRILSDYAATHDGDVSDVPEAQRNLTFQSRAEFVYSVFLPVVFRARRPVVAFNMPFDISRIAVGYGPTRATRRGDGNLRNDYRDGFSFQIGSDDRVIYEPRIKVKHVDAKRSFASFTSPRDNEYSGPGDPNPGIFLDLKTWAFALTGRPFSLESACRRFGVEHGKMSSLSGTGPVEHGTITAAYIDYNRRDVLATAELLAGVNTEHAAHPVLSEPARQLGGLAPQQAYSPASVAKSYLRGMGVTPPRDRFTVHPELVASLTGTPLTDVTAPKAAGTPSDDLECGTSGPLRSSWESVAETTPGDMEEGTIGPLSSSWEDVWQTTRRPTVRAGRATPEAPTTSALKMITGFGWSSFYGGRAEVRIRKTPVPVQVLDFTSMYPTVNALMGIWGMLTSSQLECYSDTDGVQALIDSVTLDNLFNRDTWSGLVGLCQIIPDGDVLPVRADYSDTGTFTIGLNPLFTDQPIWYTITDVIASVIITGRRPQILRALRYRTGPQMSGLRDVKLRGTVPVNPAIDDFFTTVISERVPIKHTDPAAADFLKVLANSGSYGIFAQVDPDDSGGSRNVTVHDHTGTPRTVKLGHPEKDGEYAFPFIASAITGAARLMLAMLEVSVTDAGGCWVFCDTDSLAVVANRDGGPVPCQVADPEHRSTPNEPQTTRTRSGKPAVNALSYAQVNAIRDRFHQLNPYGNAVPELLKNETEPGREPTVPEGSVPYCLAISAKSYVCYLTNRRGKALKVGDLELETVPASDRLEMGSPDQLALLPGKWKEFGLGHLLGPDSEKTWTPETVTNIGDSEDEHSSEPVRKLPRQWWIADYWRHVIAYHHAHRNHPEQELPSWQLPLPEWVNAPAFRKVTASSPDILLPFRTWNDGLDYSDQVKPFGFLIGVATGNALFTGNRRGCVPIGPYAPNPGPNHPWFDKTTGKQISAITVDPYEISSDEGATETGPLLVQDYHHVLTHHYSHPESKFIGPNGKQCDLSTSGLLQRRPTQIAYINTIGKEATGLDHVNVNRLATRADEKVNYLTSAAERERPLRTELAKLGTTEILRRLQTYDLETAKAVIDGNKESKAAIRSYRFQQTRFGTDRTREIERCLSDIRGPHVNVTPSDRTLRRIIAGHTPTGELRRALLIITTEDYYDDAITTTRRLGVNFYQKAVDRKCGCRCGTTVDGRKRYVNATHRNRVYDRNRSVGGPSAGGGGSVPGGGGHTPGSDQLRYA